VIPTDLLVAAGKLRTILASGFLAGLCVFFAPLLILALGLLAAYLSYVVGDGTTPTFGMGRPLNASDFRSVFAPAVNSPGVLAAAGLFGSALAAFRRTTLRRADPSALSGSRPFFPEFGFSYLLLCVLLVALAYIDGGWVRLHRVIVAAPVFLVFLLCATMLAHAVWQYAFRNWLELLAGEAERDAAAALRARRPALRQARHAR